MAHWYSEGDLPEVNNFDRDRDYFIAEAESFDEYPDSPDPDDWFEFSDFENWRADWPGAADPDETAPAA